MTEKEWEKKQRWFRNRLKRLQKKQDHQAIIDLYDTFTYWCSEFGWPDWWADMQRAAIDSMHALQVQR